MEQAECALPKINRALMFILLIIVVFGQGGGLIVISVSQSPVIVFWGFRAVIICSVIALFPAIPLLIIRVARLL